MISTRYAFQYLQDKVAEVSDDQIPCLHKTHHISGSGLVVAGIGSKGEMHTGSVFNVQHRLYLCRGGFKA